MSTQFNPNGTLPQATAPAAVAIASSTNTSPIAITTASPHGYTEGDTVQITGHQTNTGANGLWVVSITGASSFTLTGSTGVAVGGATGQAQDYSVNPLLTLPADGELRYASSVNTPISGQANVAPFLYQRVGALNTHAVYNSSDFSAVGAVYSTTSLSSGVWTTLTGLDNLFSAQGDRYLLAGDVLDLRIGTSIRVDADQFALAIGISYNGGAYSPISGSVRNVENSNASRIVIAAECAEILTSGWTANDRFDIALMGYLLAGGPANLILWAGYSAACRHLRSNA